MYMGPMSSLCIEYNIGPLGMVSTQHIYAVHVCTCVSHCAWKWRLRRESLNMADSQNCALINSSPPSAAYMGQWIESTLVQIILCMLTLRLSLVGHIHKMIPAEEMSTQIYVAIWLLQATLPRSSSNFSHMHIIAIEYHTTICAGYNRIIF